MFFVFTKSDFLYDTSIQNARKEYKQLKHLKFIDEHGSFLVEQPENTSCLYFPLASEKGLKSAITPNLGGDAKLDQEAFLLEPVSAENLHNNRSTRNFWFMDETRQDIPAAFTLPQEHPRSRKPRAAHPGRIKAS